MDDGEREELERLRAEVTRLRKEPRPRRRIGRWSLAVVLLVVSAVLMGLSAVAVFARNEVLDTDRFVANVAPLARDDDVREAVSARVSDRLITALDVRELTSRILDSVQTKGGPEVLDNLADPIASGIESFVAKQVRAMVYSEQFADLWTEVVRAAHSSINKVLTGEQGELVDVEDGKIVLDLAPVFDVAKQRLADRGFGFADKLPEVSVTLPLMDAAPVKQARTAATVLNAVAWILPFAALALLAAGVFAAPNRRRGLLIGSAATATVMLLLWGGLTLARSVYLNSLPDAVRSPRAAVALYDVGSRFLVTGVQTLFVLFGIVAVGCWLLGPGRVAAGLRRGFSGLRDAVARGVDRLGLPLGGAAEVVRRNRRAIEVVLIGLGLAWLVLWGHPGIPGTLTVTAVVCLGIAITEVFARLGRAPLGTRTVPPG
ncbi:MAG: hypothetical protein ACRD0P_03410 [Stackebrandtia sp.]